MDEKVIVEVDRKSRRILIASAIVIIGPLIALVYWKVSNSLGGNDLILKEASDMSFHGKVDSIYYDRQNHNTETLILSDGYLYELYRDWETFVAVGDSLAKDTGNVRVVVYRDGKQTQVLDYMELVKSFK